MMRRRCRGAAPLIFIVVLLAWVERVPGAHVVEQGWVHRHSTMLSNSFDRALKLVMVPDGGVVITGYTHDGQTANDFLTIKYASDGATVWQQRYDGPLHKSDVPLALAVDAAGNVIVSGSSDGPDDSSDFYTAKYAAGDGALLWEKRFAGLGRGEDSVEGMVVDSAGNVVVAGTTLGGNGTDDYCVIKYSASEGTILWQRRYDGLLQGPDNARAVALDPADNVIVTGNSRGATIDFVTLKFAAANGAMQWERRHNGNLNQADYVEAVTTDATGVYVAGNCRDSWEFSAFTTIKYSHAGTPLWTNNSVVRGNGFDAIPAAIHVERHDGSGNTYVVGWVGTGASYSGAVAAHSANGSRAWSSLFSSNGYGDATSLALDGAGNVYVAGAVWGPSSRSHAVLRKYSRTGTSLWEKNFSGAGGRYDRFLGVAVDAVGNAYATGASEGPERSSDYATIKASSAGTGLWTNRFNALRKNPTEGVAAVFDAQGGLYVTGAVEGIEETRMVTIKYERYGLPSWTNQFSAPARATNHPSDIVLGVNGNVVVGGFASGAGAVVAYASTGTPLWTNIYGVSNGSYLITDLAAGPEGNIYGTGYKSSGGSGNDYATVAYSGSGVALWTNQFGGIQNDEPAEVAAGLDGNVYVTGASAQADGRSGIATVAYSGAGIPLWTNLYRDTGNVRSYRGAAISIEPSGTVAVAGYSEAVGNAPTVLVMIRFSINGVVTWTNHLPTNFGPSDLSFDEAGDLYVTGPIGVPADYFTAKFASTNGSLRWSQRYGSPQQAADSPRAVVAAFGQVVVTGASGHETNAECRTVAYAVSDGRQLWEARRELEFYRYGGRSTNKCLALGPGSAVAIIGKSDGSLDPSSRTYDLLSVGFSSFLSLIPGERTDGALEWFDPADPVRPLGTYHADRYQLALSNAPPGEYAVHARSVSGFEPELDLLDATGQPVSVIPPVTSPPEPEALLVFPRAPGSQYFAQVSSVAANQTGPYEIGFFPVLRDCRSVEGSLGATDFRDSFRGGAAYFADDFLLQTLQPVLQVAVRTTNFTPRLWFWNLSDGGTNGDAFRGDGFQANGVISNATSRLWIVRVSSEETNVSGFYQLSINGGAGVTAFSPRAGLPAQLVRISTAQLDVANALTGVSFGGAIDTSAIFDPGTGQVIARVPAAARSGRIQVLAENCSAVSLEEFVVLSPVGSIRHEVAAGQLTFEVSNAVAGVQAVVESTTSLNAPILWQPLWTNPVVGPGVWRYTNQIRAVPPQQFLRVKVP